MTDDADDAIDCKRIEQSYDNAFSLVREAEDVDPIGYSRNTEQKVLPAGSRVEHRENDHPVVAVAHRWIVFRYLKQVRTDVNQKHEECEKER